MNYHKIDHIHCCESDNPPCGIKGKHRCCLCREEVKQSIVDVCASPGVIEEAAQKGAKDQTKLLQTDV